MSDIAVNYVWINKEPVKAGQVPIPLHNLERAFENAERYPNAAFQVWADRAQMDSASQETLKNIFNRFAPDNVTARDLRDIPFYNSCKIFNSDKFDIWTKSDFARLIVVEHCFDSLPHQTVIYSDFDAEDVSLEHPDVISRLDMYGMVFGATKEEHIENGYMGFRADRGRSFLIESLIPETHVVACADKNGFAAMVGALKDWAGENDYNSFYDLAVELLEPRGYSISTPLRRDYKGLGLDIA